MWNKLLQLTDSFAPQQSHSSTSSGKEQGTSVVYELTPGKRRKQCTPIRYNSPADTRVEVFWKDLTLAKEVDSRLESGFGPVISFIVGGQEVMRFDCLGQCGHFHVALVRPDPGAEIRLWFREKTIPEQVERSVFELAHNIEYYLPRNPLASVRGAQLPKNEHQERCLEARDVALALWNKNVAAQQQIAEAT